MLALLSLFPLLSTDSFNLSPFTEGHTCRQILSRGSYVNKSELAPLWYTGMCLLPGLPAFLMALPCIRRLAAGTPTHEAHALMNVCVCVCMSGGCGHACYDVAVLIHNKRKRTSEPTLSLPSLKSQQTLIQDSFSPSSFLSLFQFFKSDTYF